MSKTTSTETIATRHGQLKLVINRATGEIDLEKTKILKVPEAAPQPDPEVELVAKAIIASGFSPEEIERRTIELGRRVSKMTVLGIKTQTTRKPQNFTLTSIMMGIGFIKEWKRKAVQAPKAVGQS